MDEAFISIEAKHFVYINLLYFFLYYLGKIKGNTSAARIIKDNVDKETKFVHVFLSLCFIGI